jgi:hypothetical protein
MTIDSTTILVTSRVKNVTYNGSTATSTAALSTLVYSQNVIEFASLTTNAVTF